MKRLSAVQTYVQRVEMRLQWIQAMWKDKRVQCYNDAKHPTKKEERATGSVFLAGPTSRHQLLEFNWRSEAVHFLRRFGFEGYIYVPEPRGEEKANDFTDRSFIHHWESSRLRTARYRIFWIPRKTDEMLGLNTNLELGITLGQLMVQCPRTTKGAGVYVGWPDGAERMGLPNHYGMELMDLQRYNSLEKMCQDLGASYQRVR